MTSQRGGNVQARPYRILFFDDVLGVYFKRGMGGGVTSFIAVKTNFKYKFSLQLILLFLWGVGGRHFER